MLGNKKPWKLSRTGNWHTNFSTPITMGYHHFNQQNWIHDCNRRWEIGLL